MKVDMIIFNIGQLLTLAGAKRARIKDEMNNLAILQNAAIAIDKGRIIKAGDNDKILKEFSSENKIDAQGNVVMPGFVDSHTHPVFYQTRENEYAMRIEGKTYVEISKSGGGIRASINGVRKATEEKLYKLSVNRINELIKYGTTTLEAKSGYGLSTESEIKMLKVIKKLDETLPIDIIPTFLGAHEYPPEYKDNHKAYIDILLNDMLPKVAEMKLAKYCDIFCEEHVFNIDESREILLKAKELGFKIRMHADEIKPIGGAGLAAELKAISADHLGATSKEDITKMAKAGVIATLLPCTIFSLGMESYAKARLMIENGVAVALATDYNPGSCNCGNMQMAMTLANIKMKMTIEEAITASTVNAAYSLEMGDDTGSLEEGKKADILIMNTKNYQYIPYHFGANNVKTVIKEGKIIAEN